MASGRANSLSRTVGAYHAHNVLLTAAAEVGIPGTLLLIGFTAAIGLAVLHAARRLPDPRDRALVAGIGAALFVQVGQGLVDFNLRNPVILFLAWSLVGMVLVARRDLVGSSEDARSSARAPGPPPGHPLGSDGWLPLTHEGAWEGPTAARDG